MCRTCWFALALGIAIATVPHGSQLAAETVDLSKWDNRKLQESIESKTPGSEDERQLAEAARRGGEAWKKVLVERHKAYLALREKPAEKDDFRRCFSCDLNLLTALRRIEKKPDPLRVLITGKHKRSHSLRDRLEFSAVVINQDADKAIIHSLTKGGNDRSGRLERWRFEIRDEKGEMLPFIDHFAFGGGGISTTQDLEFGESWEVKLPLRNYVLIDKPGKYKLRLQYHDRAEIAESKNIEDLFTAQSEDIELEIDPIVVHVTEAERKQAREWIAKLPEEGPVKILMDGVVESPKDLPPDSPPGHLQRMYTDAIPDLIDAALDPDITPGKRAWVLGLLTGITGHNNPCGGFLGGADILGSYEYRSMGARGSGTGNVDPKKQKAFAEKWRPWKTDEYFKIVKLGDE
jgi:hypothetical protein